MTPDPSLSRAPLRPRYALSLADGRRWVLQGVDDDAARVVAAFAAAARLATAPEDAPGRRLLAVACEGRPGPVVAPHDPDAPLVCPVFPGTDPSLLTIGMTRVASAIGREAQSRGGLLLHGALADRPSGQGREGILLAGPGTVGKTTASNRLPPPWRSLCDDTTLVVRDAHGAYWAHPMPTWSRFYGGDGGSWDVQSAVPLRAIFFLTQSPSDRVEPLDQPASTMAMLLESVEQACRPMARDLSEDQARGMHDEWLANARALMRTVPASLLHISLTGSFWQEIERALSPGAERDKEAGEHRVGEPPGRVDDTTDDDRARRRTRTRRRPLERPSTSPTTSTRTISKGDVPSFPSASEFIVYKGSSMNPTLAEPDMLQVLPYEGRGPRVGDVLYYQPPGRHPRTVHRVVAVTPEGLRTRGDNNNANDPYRLQLSDIFGQVVAAHRGSHWRRIPGGPRGRWARHQARLRQRANRLSARWLHGAYYALADSGLFRGLLPARLQPRVVAFQARSKVYLKLMLGRRLIGQYDQRNERWLIRRPCRLFVDEAALPHPPRTAGGTPEE